MAFDTYDVYFQIFTMFGFVHVAITVMNFIISVCERMDIRPNIDEQMDRRPNIDERLDVLEQEMINLLSGMYSIEEPPRNIMSETVAPVRHSVPTKNKEEDTEMLSDTEKED